MNAHPHDDDGLPGTVYVLHFDPAYAMPATTSARPPATSTRA